MRNAAIKNITDKADELANLYWKTREEKYKILWYQKIRQVSSLFPAFPEEESPPHNET